MKGVFKTPTQPRARVSKPTTQPRAPLASTSRVSRLEPIGDRVQTPLSPHEQSTDPAKGLQGAASSAEWEARLNPPSRFATTVDRKMDLPFNKIFPPTPYFSIGDKTYFVRTSSFDDQSEAANLIQRARVQGPRPNQSTRGHWIVPHYPVDEHGGPVYASQYEARGVIPAHNPPGDDDDTEVLMDNDEDADAHTDDEAELGPSGGRGRRADPRSPIGSNRLTPFNDPAFIQLPTRMYYRPYPTPVPIRLTTARQRLVQASDADPEHTPDWRYTKLYTHVLPRERVHYEVDATELRMSLDKAERDDFLFATRMQGFQQATMDVVWPTVDQHNGERDLTDVTTLFLQRYMQKFMDQTAKAFDGSLMPIEVIREAIHMHKEFTEEWDVVHKRNLAPFLQAASEAFVGLFCNHPAVRPTIDRGASWGVLARFFRRHEQFSPVFSLCLNAYMVKTEQDKGNRNANYKAMVNMNSAYVGAMNTMHAFLTSHTTEITQVLDRLFARPDVQNHPLLHPLLIDWHWIASELPVGHQRFRGYLMDADNPDRQMDTEHVQNPGEADVDAMGGRP